ncbi:MAG TPA: GNAT family N-acetyltransferase [Bacteroidia bacterium]|nr:GNAT family N-acetyltransferase [Bacteroidia bacterium]HMU20365.1 GNAT family N-acetyltransferase [Bacteroidia bacterium]
MSKIKIVRTTAQDINFKKLETELDKDLKIKNGDKNDFFVQYNHEVAINNVIIAYVDELPVGCGAFKEFDSDTAEIKRMYVAPDFRCQGIASEILNELEKWAAELQYKKCILETGDKMIEAIGLYQKHHFQKIKNYSPYENLASSLCFKKSISNEN